MSSEPKPSAIPRPHSTPTKTSSYMTPYGYRSPKGSPKDQIPKSPTPMKTQTISPRSFSNNKVTYHREELESLVQKVEEKTQSLNELKSNILTLRTQIQQTELTQQELEENYTSVSQALQIKTYELEHVLQEKKDTKQEIQRSYELKKKQMQLENDASIYNIEKQYRTEIENILSMKVGEIQAKKSQLQEQLSKIEDEIKNNDTIVETNIQTIHQSHKDKQLELQKFMSSTRESLEKECAELEDEKEAVKTQILDFKRKHDILTTENEKLSKELEHITQVHSTNEEENHRLQQQIDELRKSLETKKQKIKSLKHDMQWKIESKIELDEGLIIEEEKRRRLHNKLQELKGNIRVFCRIRPKIPAELSEDPLIIQVPDNDEAKQELDILSSSQKKYNFKFDKVFQPDTTNNEIFEEISQLVQSALYGFNICIFAYGQTGSGKTHTMSNSDGVIPQTIHQIFDSCNKLSKRGWHYTISGEFLEIHNETIHDLLSDQSGNTIDMKKYEIKHDHQTKTSYITNLTRIQFDTPDEMETIFQRALKNRAIASTKSNEHSSRSHTVCIIRLSVINDETQESINSVINLIDLAGSERISQSGVSGDRLRETQAINKSLSCLGDVIYALGDDNAKHIPFRNSKLTYLLQYSLIEDSKTLMFVNVSPLAKNLNETVNSLRFATKVNNTGLQRKV
ncbi:CYFA0S27e00606g1_1 [Cyberlindnera fabianii]|uniref:Kinesin-like protein n=1 Tax=Cyberlindnera fabianii TaxID=36022 RepID=A0A061BAN6_CYBFA|nr:CYFA0S27e00606g1_1 [Cyberlindnera fabianii]